MAVTAAPRRGALDRDGAAAAADVPDVVAGARAERRERQRADLGLGDHPRAERERVLREGPAVWGAGRPDGRAAVGRLVDDDDVRVAERGLRRDALVGRAQRLRDDRVAGRERLDDQLGVAGLR